MSDRVGQQIGNYRLERLLGSGGFADVYLGKQVYLDSLAAIKLLKTTLTEGDIDDFRSEARTLVRLMHPHIVRILDFGLEDKVPFLVMDYAPNGTLRQRHARGSRLPLATVIEYVNQVASALQFAHDQKIIHRDVKPENMLLGRQNEILLSDFGIAVVAQSTRTEFTKETVGTISYMAPEQIQAHPRPASDQYSLGVIAYEWLSGDRPFNGTFTEIAVKHMMTPVPPLREKISSISPEIEQVILTALAKDPTQRFGSVQAFATALEQASYGIKKSFPAIAPTQIAPQPAPAPTLAPTILASPVTPILPLMQPDVHNTPAHSQAGNPIEATAIETPGTPFQAPSPAYIEANAPTIATPYVQSYNPATPPPPGLPTLQRQAEPERKGMTRRAALIAGVSAVGVVAIGGTALILATHHTPTTTGAGTQTTPSATPRTTATTQVNPNLLEQDNFHRANQQFWGTASNNHVWGGDANKSPDFSIANGVGQIKRNVNPGNLYTAVLGTAQTNSEVIATAMIDTFNNSHIAVLLRYQDDNHYYKARILGTVLDIFNRKDVNHGATLSSIAFKANPGTFYTIRFRAVGPTLLTKAWQTGTPEPADWMVATTDTTFQSGQGGFRPQLDHGVTMQVSMFQENTATGV
ncbi:MAG TPA: protein kinase [Ktedonobacteraceae bacterium]|nr:protein kinase [Ktedonobacteraceae bacterium]